MKSNLLFCLLFSLLFSCNNNDKNHFPDVRALVDTVRIRYVPDRRDDVYEITVSACERKPVLRGVTSVSEAKADLLFRLRNMGYDVIDSIRLLPDETVEGFRNAVANVSVADLRVKAGHASEMATQLLLGTPMQLLEKRSGWYRVKTPENYVAWVQRETVTSMNEETFVQWEAARKIIFTDDYGFAYETTNENGQRSSDLVFGNLLKWESDAGRFYNVSYPDARRAYILKAQCQMFDDWEKSICLTEESIVEKALELKGIPYTWGGTSVKAMDCSGFTKTVFLKHGIMLSRDASQQAKNGIHVDISDGYDKLRPGDLMFFGTKADDDSHEKIRHVGIYIGNMEFIHAAGYVHISSLNPAEPHYDEGNTQQFIRARRITINN